MKFFTPELFLRGNSDDVEEVNRAEAEWDEALERYASHYKKIEATLPQSLRRFHDEQCLHDADIIGPATLSQGVFPSSDKDVVIIAQQTNTLFEEYLNTLAILHYDVTEAPRIEYPTPSPLFAEGQPIWLYEEIDLLEPGLFQHEILLSTGRVIRIRFRDFRYEIAPLVGEVNGISATTTQTGALIA